MCDVAALWHLLHKDVGFVTHTTLHTLELPRKPHHGPVIHLIIGDIEMCSTGTLSAYYRYIGAYISCFECQSECDPHILELAMNSILDADPRATHECQSGAIG